MDDFELVLDFCSSVMIVINQLRIYRTKWTMRMSVVENVVQSVTSKFDYVGVGY